MTVLEFITTYENKKILDEIVFQKFTQYVNNTKHMMGDEQMDSYEYHDGYIYINWTAQYKYDSNQKGVEKIDINKFLGD